MNLYSAIRRRSKRSASSFDLTAYATMIEQGMWGGAWGGGLPTLGAKQEEIAHTFDSYAAQLYAANPIVFGCMQARSSLFSEASFRFRQVRNGLPGELFGTAALAPLEEPYPGGSTQSLLKRMINDADLAGNWFGVRRSDGRIMRLRPDWVTIVLGGQGYGGVDTVPVGYLYTPGGGAANNDSYAFAAEEVAHWAPIPDPQAPYRGMSWLTPVLREVMGDQAATSHKLKYLEEGATSNMVVTVGDGVGPDDFAKFKELFDEEYSGIENAFRTIFLGGGADVKHVGDDMQKADWKNVTALSENRICVGARVPGIIAGTSEGLASATYSNFAQARRAFTDGTMAGLWRDACSALEPIIKVPGSAILWYDATDIPYLQEDRKDAAEIAQKEATTIETLIKAGFDPDSVVEAVKASDLSRLVHSGLVSVQLQKPGEAEEEPEEGATNGVVPAALMPPVGEG